MRNRSESFRTKGFQLPHSMRLKVKLSFKLFAIMLHKGITETWHPDYEPDYGPDYDHCQEPPGAAYKFLRFNTACVLHKFRFN